MQETLGHLMASATSRQKFILLQVRQWKRPLPPGVCPTAPDPCPPADKWLIINHNSDGPEIFNIFDEVPDICFRLWTSSALVGSSLYVVGGRGWSPPYNICRLDTLNPADGWKTCNPLPFECARPHVFVAGNFLYLLPDCNDFKTADGNRLWGYVYDTIEQKGHPMEPPPTYSGSDYRFRFPLFPLVRGNRLGLVPLVEGEQGYFHNTDQNSWEPDYSGNLSSTNAPSPSDAPYGDVLKLYAFSDGIHYVYAFGSSYLYAYDFHSRRFYQIRLPEGLIDRGLGIGSVSAVDHGSHMVAIGDSKLCIFWQSLDREMDIIIHYTKMEVSLDAFPAAFILDYIEFENLNVYVKQCLTFDSYPHLNEEISISTSNDTGKQGDSYLGLTEEIPISKSNEMTQNCDSYPGLTEEIPIFKSNETTQNCDSYPGLTEEMPISKSNETAQYWIMETDYHSLFGEYLRLQKENKLLLEKVQRTPVISQQNISKILWSSSERTTVSSPSAHVVASPIIMPCSPPNYLGAPVVSSLKGLYSNGNRYLARGIRFLRNCIQK